MSRTEDELYKDSKMTGWTDYTTMRGVNTTSNLINDAAAILHHLENSGKLKRFLNTFKGYVSHINQDEKTAHELTLAQIANIIENLYIKYRELGYYGDIPDMLDALFTKIDVVTYAEATAGVDDVKAVSARKFPYQFIVHDRSPKAHLGVLTSFMPEDVVKIPPSISYINLYENKYEKWLDVDTGYHVFDLLVNHRKWNPTHGTIYITVNCDLSTIEVPIFALLTNSSTSFICYYRDNRIGMKRFNSFTNAFNIVGEVDLELLQPDKRRFVFSYSPRAVILRSILKPVINIVGSFRLDATKLKLHVPFYSDDHPSVPSIVRWVYYPKYIDSDAQLAALLS